MDNIYAGYIIHVTTKKPLNSHQTFPSERVGAWAQDYWSSGVN